MGRAVLGRPGAWCKASGGLVATRGQRGRESLLAVLFLVGSRQNPFSWHILC